MVKKDRHLPPRVFVKGSRYYLVRADGKRRVWVGLSPVREGLPALYAALAQLLAAGVADDRMPAVIAAWQRDVMPRHADKTQRDELAMCKVIAESFADFSAGLIGHVEKTLKDKLTTMKVDLRPSFLSLHEKLAAPLFLPLTPASACFTLDVRAIEASPSIMADGLEKQLALTVAPSLTRTVGTFIGPARARISAVVWRVVQSRTHSSNSSRFAVRAPAIT